MLVFGATARADYRTDVGYDALQAELGAGLPTGAGVGVSQIEAPEGGTNFYRPDIGNGEFVSKTINFPSGGLTGASGHATTVGSFLYGSGSSLSPGVSVIDVYEVNSWLQTGFLRVGGNSEPAVENRAVSNHSWIGTFGSTANDQEALRRFDYIIQRDDFVAVVALNNGSGTSVPSLLGSSYNGIVVGLSSGEHSSGTTPIDSSGRVKPDIVVPANLTSYGTPSVGSAAALLLQKATTLGFTNAAKSVTMKAILLAGATKSQFSTWDRTTTRPIDEHYGAGQLNVYHSYHVLTAGAQAASSSVSVRARGWDFGTASTSAARRYFFDIAAGDTASGFTAALTWNRVIADTLNGSAWGNPSSSLANLTLKLSHATGFTVGSLVDSSESTLDNVEYLYLPTLAPGRYVLEVSTDANVNYGLAWNSVPTVIIAATTPSAAEQGAVPGTFTITRAGETVESLTVNFTIGGSAVNGTDYTTIPASVTMPAGASTATVTIAPIADALAEGPETVTLSLANHLAYATGGASSATVTIADKPFDAWRFAEFTALELSDPLISGAEADPDQDGIRNLLEYALQLPPKVASTAGLPIAGRDLSGALTLSYTLVKSASDITVVPEISTDLALWHTGAGYVSVQSTDQGATWSVVATSQLSPATEPRQFLRVRVTQP